MFELMTAKIDWLTCTMKCDDMVPQPGNLYEAKDFALHLGSDLFGSDDWTIEFKRQEGFYPWVFEVHPYGVSIAISKNVQNQGVRVVFPGKSCADAWFMSGVIEVMKSMNFRCTRVDMAVDETNCAWSWDVIAETLQKFCDERGLSFGKFSGKKGDTVYAGSRNSNNYLRVYDKAKEQGVMSHWTRIEGEFKGDVAAMLWDAPGTLHENALRHMAAWLSKWYHPLSEALIRHVKGDAEQMRPGRKSNSDRLLWLDRQVLPALRKLAEDDMQAASDWIDKAHALIDALKAF